MSSSDSPFTVASPSAAADGARPSQRAEGDGLGDGLIVAPTQPRRGALLVRVLGEVDLLNADRLEAVLTDAVAALAAEHGQTSGPLLLVCDMQGVEFLGASGLAALTRVGASAVQSDVGWMLVATTTAVRRPLELVALDGLVPLASTSPLHDAGTAATDSTADGVDAAAAGTGRLLCRRGG